MNDNDIFLALAIKEALKGGVFTHPNPRVGCIIVKNGNVISKGYHKIFGGEHAEVNASKKLSPQQLKGSSLYVTLEPCSTYGKTPPCTELIIQSKIKKVVIGTLDPNSAHNGRGIEILKKHGISVEFGSQDMEEKCRNINPQFNKNMTKNMPYVTLKFASSIDGKIANKNYYSKWISSQKARIYAHKLRAETDCIIVGVNTIVKDNPTLNVRCIKTRKQPSVCIIDLKCKTPQNSNVFSIDRDVFIITNKKKNYFGKGVNFLNPKIKGKIVDLNYILKNLYQKGVRSVLVEGGGKTIASFIKQEVFDKICCFISPVIIGSDGIGSVGLPFGFEKNKIGIRLKIEKISKIDNDILIEMVKYV